MKPYYDDGHVQIFHGDCRDVLPSIGDRIDLILTDPPYGIPILHSSNLGPRNPKKGSPNGKSFPPLSGNDVEFDPSFLLRFECCLWGANHYAHRLPHNGRWLVWDKRAGKVPPRSQADCEMAWCSSYGAARVFYHMWDGMVKDSEVGIARDHPTQKPVALMLWCLRFFPSVGRVVDPYMGSGTTLVACKRDGRKSIGIEIEERYCEIAAERLAQGSLFVADDGPVSGGEIQEALL